MLIDQPQTTLADDWLRTSVSVSLETDFPLLPGEFKLWYEIPPEFRHAVRSDRGDAFVVALLFLAMRLHEDIQVRAPMSPRLLRGLREYQQIFPEWFDYLQAVEINHEGYATSIDGNKGTGTFFSGGVDSFFTLWSHLAENESIPDYEITHGLFIDGFDTQRPGTSTFKTFFDTYESMFDNLGLTLIPVRTNLKTYVNNETTGWRASHGTFLISVPLLIQSCFNKCYVPSTEQYSGKNSFKYGSNPLVDHLLSTETLQIIHDGAWASRAEKTEMIAEWRATHEHLYVCFSRENDSLENCCRCEKCIRTMIALKLAGRLDEYSTFPLSLKRRDIRSWEMPYYTVSGSFAEELVEHATEKGHSKTANDLRYVMWKHRIRNSMLGRFLRKLIVEPAKRSKWISKVYYWLKA